MKQMDCILTQPMKASLQDFPVALFYSAVQDVSKFWVCVWNPMVWNLFFFKNWYKVKYFCSLTSSRHLHGLTELNRWMMLIIMWLTTPKAGQNWTTSCIHPREVARNIRLRFTDEILFVEAPACFLKLAHLPRSRKKKIIYTGFFKSSLRLCIVFCVKHLMLL